MKTLAIIVMLAGTAVAGPVARVGLVGGYDSSAPNHQEDGVALGAGYQLGGFTAELDYSYLQYDDSNDLGGVGGGATRAGLLMQARLLSLTCHQRSNCPHFDLDAGVGERWVNWQPNQTSSTYTPPATERQGRDLSLGISATFGLHFSLHYVLFQPDVVGPQISCRGVCTMQPPGSDNGLLLEASFLIGG